MTLKFNCLNCGKELIYSHLQIGQTGVCKHCGQQTEVPQDAVTFDASGQPSIYIGEKNPSNSGTPQERYPALIALRQLIYAIGMMAILASVVSCFVLIALGPIVILYATIGAVSALILMAFAELIRLFMDIEKHVREMKYTTGKGKTDE